MTLPLSMLLVNFYAWWPGLLDKHAHNPTQLAGLLPFWQWPCLWNQQRPPHPHPVQSSHHVGVALLPPALSYAAPGGCPPALVAGKLPAREELKVGHLDPVEWVLLGP